jgi:hypothetical protein
MVLGVLAAVTIAGCSSSTTTDPVVQEKVKASRLDRLEKGKKASLPGPKK